mmetsp:Transcript_7223/g.14793  ORF Transcript_7223/g.14793 Transcript_7223/m.14793 type:complete len:155 (-) Transcript_7223:449-913(-)
MPRLLRGKLPGCDRDACRKRGKQLPVFDNHEFKRMIAVRCCHLECRNARSVATTHLVGGMNAIQARNQGRLLRTKRKKKKKKKKNDSREKDNPNAGCGTIVRVALFFAGMSLAKGGDRDQRQALQSLPLPNKSHNEVGVDSGSAPTSCLQPLYL